MNPLDPILNWYQAARDAIRVTRRVVNQGIQGAITNRHAFFGLSNDERRTSLDTAMAELDFVAILALVAALERVLREYVIVRVDQAFNIASQQDSAIAGAFKRNADFWNFSDTLLEVFVVVDSATRGQVKQLIDLRNWVAHGHFLSKPAPLRATPKAAHATLTNFMQQAAVI